MSDNKYAAPLALLATMATTGAVYGGVGWGVIALADAHLGDKLETATTEYQQRASAAFEENLEDIMKMRDDVVDIEYKSYEAYQSGDKELYETLIQDMQDSAEAFDTAYDNLVMGALTNKFLSEADYKDLVEQIEDNNLPNEIKPNQGPSFYIDGDDAEYLEACRLESKDGVFPLRPVASDAHKVATCMAKSQDDYNEAVVGFPLMSMFLMTLANILAFGIRHELPQEALYDSVKNRLNQSRKKNKLGQN